MPEAENEEKKVTDPVVEDKKPDPVSEEMIGGKKFSDLDPDTQKHFTALREENKTRRLAFEAAQKELNDIKTAQAAKDQEAKLAAEKALQEQGNYKQLYEAAQPQLKELETAKAKVTELETFVSETLEARIKAIPQGKRSLVDALPPMDNLAKLKWLEANTALFATPNAPDLDAGNRKPTGQQVNAQALEEMHQEYSNRFWK